MKDRSMSTKIPATVITGFLGAGKTSLIQHLLRTANGRRLALIINEFGEIGVDGEILKGCGIEGCEDENIIELANGCICCTVADDFLPTIEALLDRPKPPDHIVIETSGLALPKPLVKAFAWPEVRTRVTVDGVIAVVDGPAAAAGRFADDPRRWPRSARRSERSTTTARWTSCSRTSSPAPISWSSTRSTRWMRRRAPPRSGDRRQLRAAVKLRAGELRRHRRRRAAGPRCGGRGRSRGRRSHHDAEGEHDHDDFESFHVDLPELADPATLLERRHGDRRGPRHPAGEGLPRRRGKAMRLVLQGVGSRAAALLRPRLGAAARRGPAGWW